MRAVAVVGVAGRFPGAADLDALWESIVGRRSASRRVPEGRWPVPVEEMLGEGPDRALAPMGCFLDEAVEGSALATELAREAWTSAAPKGIDPARVPVILANILLPTEASSLHTRQSVGAAFEAWATGRPLAGLPESAAADPISQVARDVASSLGLGGGAFTVDAACASSLFALAFACKELEAGRADAVLAGGVSLPHSLYTQVGFSQLGALSPSGRCLPFDSRADGLVVGEGGAIFVLQRLEDAIAAGRPILGVIRGFGLSNDVGGSLLSPEREGQLRAMRAAYADAGWSPASVDLFECHGTGTPRGDAVELSTLQALLESESGRRPVIGSVKSNIGHLLVAAGSAGLAKVLLAFRNRVLPPTAGFSSASALPGPWQEHMRVLEEAEPWEAPEGHPRRAALSAFGFGGTNAHLLLEAWEPEASYAQDGLGAEFPAKAGTSFALRTSSSHGRRGIADAGSGPAFQDTGDASSGSASRLAPSSAVIRDERAKDASADDAIAIVGMAAHFGPLPDLRSFRDALLRGETIRSAPPPGRWLGFEKHPAFRHLVERGGAFVEAIEIAGGRLRIPPKELFSLLPQQLLALQVALDAVEDAGGLRQPAPRQRMGAVVGLGLDPEANSFHLRWLLRAKVGRWAREAGETATAAELDAWTDELLAHLGPELDSSRTLGALGGVVASRIARELHLGGPSLTLSAGERSGLQAVEQACDLIRGGELDTAIACAVDMAGDLRQVLAREGDAPPADGAGTVVLKRLADARRDGDRIYAILRPRGAVGFGLEPSSTEEREAASPTDDACDFDGSVVEKVLGHAGAASSMATLLHAVLSVHHGDAARATVRADGGAGLLLERWEESPPTEVENLERAEPEVALFLVANDTESLRALLSHLSTKGDLHALATSWWRRHGRGKGPLRAFVASSKAELFTAIDGALAAGCPLPAHAGLAGEGELAFVFPGSGNAAPEHYRELARTFPQLHRAERLSAGEPSPARTMLRQVAQGLSLAELLQSFGLRPQAMIGYSLGESTALLASGAWSDPGEIFRRTIESPLFNEELFPPFRAAQRAWSVEEAEWTAAVVQYDAAKLRAALEGTAELLIVNAPGECVIGGSRADLEALGAKLQSPLFFLADVPISHCSVMREVAEAYRAHHLLPTRAPAGVRIYSGAWGESYLPTPERAADAILAHATEGFDFVRLIERAHGDGVRVFLEVGPQASCTRMIERILGDARGLAAAACPRERAPLRAFLDALGKLAEAGLPLNLSPLYGPAQTIRVPVGRELPASPPAPPWRKREATPNAPTPTAGGEPKGPTSTEAQRPVHVPATGRATGGAAPALRSRVSAAQPPLSAVPDAPLPTVSRAPLSTVPRESGSLPGAPTVSAPPAPTPERPAVRPAAPSGKRVSSMYDERTAAALRLAELAASTARAHQLFLRGNQQATALQADLLQQQRALWTDAPAPSAAGPSSPSATPAPTPTAPRAASSVAAGAPTPTVPRAASSIAAGAPTPTVPRAPLSTVPRESGGLPGTQPQPTPSTAHPTAPKPSFTREQCLEFATGSIAKVLGPAFAEVDHYPTRVRLPDEPLMLVDRILEVSGPLGERGPCGCITEHDVRPDAWYLDGGRAPVCISLEAGQADLFLCAWAGMDLVTKGEQVYRLLDAFVTFHRDLPRAGETIRYDIRVHRFIQQGTTHLLFFEYDATIDGQPFLTMRDGCAGFFSKAQLESGRGIVEERSETPKLGARRLPDATPFRRLVPEPPRQLDDAAIEALRHGDAAGAFGPAFAGMRLPEALRIPSGNMRLVDRIVDLDPQGGRYGLGTITGEADIDPDAWFLRCHFVDDQVMPGTLMYQCCEHTLRIFLLAMGWSVDENDAPEDLHLAPLVDVGSKLRCRGQVTADTKKVHYRIDIKEIGYGPEPYVLADASMLVDGLHAVEMKDMSIRLVNATQQLVEDTWRKRGVTLP